MVPINHSDPGQPRILRILFRILRVATVIVGWALLWSVNQFDGEITPADYNLIAQDVTNWSIAPAAVAFIFAGIAWFFSSRGASRRGLMELAAYGGVALAFMFLPAVEVIRT